MKELYKIYLENFNRFGSISPVPINFQKPLSFTEWFALLIVVYEESREKEYTHKQTITAFASLFFNLTIDQLEDYNFVYLQDGGGISFREKVLKNNNDLIDSFNKLTTFLL